SGCAASPPASTTCSTCSACASAPAIIGVQGSGKRATLSRFSHPLQKVTPSQDAALLALADGTVFRGRSIGAPATAVGEVVFNTAITGYQEILTDPSYCRQIVTLTYPHIGNTGTNAEDVEADKVFAAGLVIRDLPAVTSNWRSTQDLTSYLREQNVVGIADIDTRKLTRLLRE